MIKFSKISKVFNTGDLETKALKEIDLEIDDGDFIVIKGPSGSGKSTLLNLIAMIDRPTAGTFFVDNMDLTLASESIRSGVRKKKIGMVFQNYNLIDELTVYENIEMPLLYNSNLNFNRKERVSEIMAQLGISEKGKAFPAELSGGQQQRVAVARAIVAGQEVVLADEPTGNLDSENGTEVISLLARLHSEGKTVIVVSHSDDFDKYATKRLTLKDGKIIDYEKIR